MRFTVRTLIPSRRKAIVFLAISMVAAFFIAKSHPPLSYEDQLVRLQAIETLEPVAPNLLKESLEIQSYLLDYSRDPSYATDQRLFLKTIIALSVYPEPTRKLLQLYGLEPEFKEVLSTYGEVVVPVITYFLDHKVVSLQIKGTAETTLWNICRYWGIDFCSPPSNSNAAEQSVDDHRVRGLYAITFIKADKHRFIAQFDIVQKTGEAKWNATNRVVTGLGDFFTSGVATINSKYNVGEPITGRDIFFAATDVIPLVVAGKLAKLVTTGTKEVSIVAKTRIYGSKLIPRSSIFQTLGKYGVTAATIYIVATNPSLISSTMEAVGNWLGIDPTLAKIVGWSLLIAILLYPISGLLTIMARIVLAVLTWIRKPNRGDNTDRPRFVSTFGRKKVAYPLFSATAKPVGKNPA